MVNIDGIQGFVDALDLPAPTEEAEQITEEANA